MKRTGLNAALVFLVLFLVPSMAYAGIGDPIIAVLRDAAASVKTALTILLGMYVAVVGYKWFSGSQDAQRHTLFAIIGGVLLLSTDQIIAALGGG